MRAAMLGHLVNVRQDLGERVAAGLGHDAPIEPRPTTVPARTDVAQSPKLSILKRASPTLEGRIIGCLVTEGADAGIVAKLTDAATDAKAVVKIVAPKLGGVTLSDGSKLAADHQLAGGPSVLFGHRRPGRLAKGSRDLAWRGGAASPGSTTPSRT